MLIDYWLTYTVIPFSYHCQGNPTNKITIEVEKYLPLELLMLIDYWLIDWLNIDDFLPFIGEIQ